MYLSLSRFVNLVYFHIIEWMKPEDRKKLDRALENKVDAEGVPSWWTSDEDAAQSGLAVARAFGFNPNAMMAAN